MSQPSSSSSSTTAMEQSDQDVEIQKTRQEQASHWSLVKDQIHITTEVLNWPYKGSGTEEDPYVVEYIKNDRRDPLLFPAWKKWVITILVAFVSLLYPFEIIYVASISYQNYITCTNSNVYSRCISFKLIRTTGNVSSSLCLSSIQWRCRANNSRVSYW